MAQQTAVEWYAIEHRKLLIQLESKELSLGEYVVKHQDILEQAKQMEREQTIDFAFNTYYYISGIMKVPFNQVSENKNHAEDNYTRLQNETN